MATWELTRETLLDLFVNAVPLFILLFFSGLFLAVNPWGWDPFVIGVTHFLTLFPFVLLLLLSYVAGLKVQTDAAGEHDGIAELLKRGE